MESQEMQWLLEEKYAGKKSQAFFTDCKKLALGEPLAYLIGHTPFLGCKIWLDSHPLIPRPETEFWTEEAIKTISNSETLSLGLASTQPRILDLCAGSGCIGVAIAKSIPESLIDFSEIDHAHLSTIEKNLRENNIEANRYSIVHSNLFEKLSSKYDYIFSNPPYIDKSLNRTDESVITHEPYISLFGGKDGLEIINTLIEKAPSYMSVGSQLWIEHEPEQSVPIKNIADKNGFSSTVHKDQYKVERYSILVLQ